MKHIFYFTGIFVILTEWMWVVAPLEKTKDTKEFHELHKRYKGVKYDDAPQEYKDQVKKNIWGLVVFLWLMMGLFTFQWAAFAAILLFNGLIIAPLSKLIRYSMAYTVMHWLNSLLGMAFAMFTIINAYHLKVNPLPLILNLFQ